MVVEAQVVVVWLDERYRPVRVPTDLKAIAIEWHNARKQSQATH